MNTKSKLADISDKSPIDLSSALERIGGDKSFLKELLDIYYEDFQEKLPNLYKALEEKDFNQIQELGHSLKGSSASLSLLSLQEASLHMEMAGRETNIKKAKETLYILENEFKRLKDFLSKKIGKYI
ncbi:MAG: Hpt domain-containing protein [Candidatus Aminicenantaceae bacterium]